jgi:hypothetical protein
VEGLGRIGGGDSEEGVCVDVAVVGADVDSEVGCGVKVGEGSVLVVSGRSTFGGVNVEGVLYALSGGAGTEPLAGMLPTGFGAVLDELVY